MSKNRLNTAVAQNNSKQKICFINQKRINIAYKVRERLDGLVFMYNEDACMCFLCILSRVGNFQFIDNFQYMQQL